MRKEIYNVAGKMVGEHDTNVQAMVDTWESLLISVDHFQSSIVEVGVPYAKTHGITTWIVDTSAAIGAFKMDVQKFIEETVAPSFAAIGIKYFIIILPASAIGKMSAKKVAQTNDAQEGMQTIEVFSWEDALKAAKGMAV